MQSHLGELILGILASAFFTLIWRRLDFIDGRIASFQTEVNGRIGETNGRIATFQAEVNGHFATIEAELRYFHGETGKTEGRLDELSKRIS